MSPYLVNLTNNLISKNGYDRLQLSTPDFLRHVKTDLEIGDVARMNPETLGRIMASFSIGEVMTSKPELFGTVEFSGDCEDLLRQLVAACLAYTIKHRIYDARELNVPPYRKRAAHFHH